MKTDRQAGRRTKHARKLFSGLATFLMWIYVLIVFLPLLWMLSTSLRLPSESFTLPPSFLPTSFHFENYTQVFKVIPFAKFIWNSIFIAVIALVLQLIVNTLASYAFARLEFYGKKILFMCVLCALMIPYQVVFIPQFLMMSSLNLVDTPWSLILLNIINPLSIFLTRQNMMGIPKSYDEAAYIDGAGKVTIFLTVILPMTTPVLIAVGVLAMVNIWNNYFQGLIYLTSNENLTIPIGLTLLNGSKGTGSLSVIFAACIIAIIFPILVFIFGQKYLVNSVSLSGLKA